MEIKKQSLLTSSLSSDSSISTKKPPEKQWIGHNKRLDRHTLGRIDAAAQVGMFAILTVASTIKLIGRIGVLVGKKICCMNTSSTIRNLGADAIIAASCFEKIFRSAWRVFSAPKLKDFCAIDAGKLAVSSIFTANHYGVIVKTMAREKLDSLKASYTSSTGRSEPLQKTEKRKLKLKVAPKNLY